MEVDFEFRGDGKGMVCVIATTPGNGRWYQSRWIPRLLALGYAESANWLTSAILANRPYEAREAARITYRVATTIFPGFKSEDDWND